MRKEYHTDKTDKITMQDVLSEKATVEELVAQLSTEELAEFCVCLEADMAQALGQSLAARLGPRRPILCLDRVKLTEGAYLDVAAPLGPAIPVVVKTLVLSTQG